MKKVQNDTKRRKRVIKRKLNRCNTDITPMLNRYCSKRELFYICIKLAIVLLKCIFKKK